MKQQARKTSLLFRAVLGFALAGTPFSSGAAEPAQPAPPQHPALSQLSKEIREVYQQTRPGLVRLQLPSPRWVNDYAMAPLTKWSQITPEMRQKLEEQAARNAAGPTTIPSGGPNQAGPEQSIPGEGPAQAPPANPPQQRPSQQQTYQESTGQQQTGQQQTGQQQTGQQPGQQSTGQQQTGRPPTTQPQGTTIYVQSGNQAANSGGRFVWKLTNAVASGPQAPSTVFTPNVIGILLDEQGHILIPLYVEREACAAQPIRLVNAEGRVVEAKFIGSDRQTNLSLVQVEKPAGKPIRLGGNRPADGSILLCLSPADGTANLVVWAHGCAANGLVVDTDGQVAGIARGGQFLSGFHCRAISDQLTKAGTVKRAKMGILISQIRPDELQRQAPALPLSGGMRVDDVLNNSPAQKAGFQIGDVILNIGEQPVEDIPTFAAVMASQTGPIQIEFLRGEHVLKMTIDLPAAQ